MTLQRTSRKVLLKHIKINPGPSYIIYSKDQGLVDYLIEAQKKLHEYYHKHYFEELVPADQSVSNMETLSTLLTQEFSTEMHNFTTPFFQKPWTNIDELEQYFHCHRRTFRLVIQSSGGIVIVFNSLVCPTLLLIFLGFQAQL
ncbi:hypothetical protein BDQ17DRAFT_1320184 [Cyathus striatus]|nr:hypothetical protein BDQ17DRAFT_1320184 [Cyathus striatus]